MVYLYKYKTIGNTTNIKKKEKFTVFAWPFYLMWEADINILYYIVI